MINKTNQGIEYSFTAAPTNLICALDANLTKGLITLIRLQSFYQNEEGWFFRTNEDLQKDFKMGKRLTIAVIETLFRNNLLQVKSVGFTKKGGTKRVNFFKVNTSEFKKYEKIDIYTITNVEELQIETLKYQDKDFKVTYTEVPTEEEVNNTQNTQENVPSCHSNETDGVLPSNVEEKRLEEEFESEAIEKKCDLEKREKQEEAVVTNLFDFADVEEELDVEEEEEFDAEEELEKEIEEAKKEVNAPKETACIKPDLNKVERRSKEEEKREAFEKAISILKKYDKASDHKELRKIQFEFFNFINDATIKGLLTRDNKIDFTAVFERVKSEKTPF